MTERGSIPADLGGAAIDAAALDRDPGIVLEALGQGICVCEVDGRIVWGNRVFRGFALTLQKRVAVACRRAASRGRGWKPGDPLRWRRRSVRVQVRSIGRAYQVTVSPIQGDLASDACPRFVATVTDVTAQDALRRKILAINRAGQELLRFEPDTIKKMHVAERLGMLQTKVISAARELLAFTHFNVRLIDEKSGRLDLVMSSGLPEKACQIELFARPEGNGISGFVAATGKSYICPDVAKDPRYVYGMDKVGSSLTVPLRLFDRVLGVFNVEHEEAFAFSEDDRHFAEIFGGYIAMSLHILNLLVVERYTTSQSATGTVQGELAEPLNDLLAEAEALRDQVQTPEAARHVDQILGDVDKIRRRIRNVAKGPQTLLGVEDSIRKAELDPLLARKRILVVDNEAVIRDTMREVFEKRGAEVTQCADGTSAVKLLDQWRVSQDPDQGFDLIVSDINIGDKTGYEVFAAAKGASATAPVILVTGFGYDPHHSIVRASQEGLQCVLFKPFQVEKLLDEARKALSERG
ncbi:MAG TPA: hypothetical protein DEB06_02420 [Phycisphaerales bacterium]|nr:hypothetical protein [Phycisphaerales bacterium]